MTYFHRKVQVRKQLWRFIRNCNTGDRAHELSTIGQLDGVQCLCK